mgnify:CR=1 FL=1
MLWVDWETEESEGAYASLRVHRPARRTSNHNRYRSFLEVLFILGTSHPSAHWSRYIGVG